jgi:tetratricopeptide (TPR) repeat protein
LIQQPSTRALERLNLASSYLFQQRPLDAVTVLESLKAEEPALVEARRLLGIALRLVGNLAQSEEELNAALAFGPRTELYEALGATLESAQRRPEAEAAYRAALKIDPLSAGAAIELSELLLNENRSDEALEVIAPVGLRSGADIHALSAHALALKALRRFDDAIAVYQRAAQITPNSAVAQHNLGAAFCDVGRFAEAEAAARGAFSRGLDASQTWLMFARALQGQDRFDEAEAAYKEALKRDPSDVTANSDLAQLVWMCTEQLGLACATLDQVIAYAPPNSSLVAAKARVLEYAGERDAAYLLLTEAMARMGEDHTLQVQASYLAGASDPERALAHAKRAWAFQPDTFDTLNALCLANLALGRAEEAAELAEAIRRRAPFDQHAIAQLATAWRMLGDPRYGELHDYEAMVRAQTIDTPPGWSSLDAFLSDLAQSLYRRHPLRAHPIGQSLRHGTQTQQRLDRSDDPVIRAFFQAIDGPIRRYMQALGSGADPLRVRNTGNYRVDGVWSVRLRPGGFHTNHVHQQGWLSSACYIELPKAIERDHQGWIKFGEPGVPTRPALPPEKYVKPELGSLVLFPSSMWHGTVPFEGDEPRLSIALDIVPA